MLRFPLASFFLLAYVITWTLASPHMLTARGIVDLPYTRVLEILAAFGPFAAALVVLGVTQGQQGINNLFASLMRWRVPPAWLLFSIFSPLGVLVGAVAWQGQLPRLLSGDVFSEIVAAGALVQLVLIGGLLQGFGEEPGWRGYALPQLRGRYGALLATLALFPVWLFWHLPFFLARPEFALGAFLGFSAGIFAAAVWCTRIYDVTRSVLMVALWHALINMARNVSLAVSPEAFRSFGMIVLMVALVIIAVWLWRRPGPYSANDA